jgi:hypothetical protein
MRATYPVYVLPLLAPLCLASGGALAALAGLGHGRWRPLAVALTTSAALYPVGYTLAFPDPGFDPRPALIAAAIERRVPGRPVFVVDYDPAIYALSGAPMPTRFPFPQHLMCDFPALPVDPVAELRRIMARRPAALVITANRRRMVCEQPARADLVMRIAQGAGYRRLDRYDGPGGPVELWIAPGM